MQKACVLRIQQRNHEHRRCACAPLDTRRWLGVGGCRWTSHRGRAPKERSLSPVRCPFPTMGNHKQRCTMRARSMLECCEPFSPETASAGATAPRKTRSAGLALDAAADTSHRSYAPKQTGMFPVRCISMVHALITYLRSAQKASCCASPETASTVRRLACTARDIRRWLCVGGLQLARCTACAAEREKPPAGAAPFCKV